MNEELMQVAQAVFALYGDLWAIEPGRFVAWLQSAPILLHEIEEDREPQYGLYDGKTVEQCSMSVLRDRTSSSGTFVGVLPLEGPITPKGNGWLGGGTALNRWTADLAEMASMENVGAIVVDTDSPGGSVAGLVEAAEAIRRAKQQKPISFISNTWMASAAYWLGSQGSDVYISPSGEIGSVGVYSLHLDFSGMLEKSGIAATFVHAGEHKVEGNPLQPLSESAKQEMQASVDYYYDRFIKEVASGRRVAQAKVKSDFGGGRMLRPEKAVEVGMADGIMRMDDLLLQHATRIKNRQRRAESMQQMKEEITKMETEQPVAPLPNFHACRLADPSKFQDGSFRTIQRNHKGKPYSVIIGKKKGESAMSEQAYRYRKSTWDASEARSHCKDHGGTFEAASD